MLGGLEPTYLIFVALLLRLRQPLVRVGRGQRSPGGAEDELSHRALAPSSQLPNTDHLCEFFFPTCVFLSVFVVLSGVRDATSDRMRSFVSFEGKSVSQPA